MYLFRDLVLFFFFFGLDLERLKVFTTAEGRAAGSLFPLSADDEATGVGSFIALEICSS